MDDDVVFILMCIYSEDKRSVRWETVASFGETSFRFVNTWWKNSNIKKWLTKVESESGERRVGSPQLQKKPWRCCWMLQLLFQLLCI